MKAIPLSVMALFCEDIREEVGGTFTLVGIMPDNLNVLTLPGFIPKLCIYIRIQYQPDAKLGEIKARLIQPEGDPMELGHIDQAMVENSLKEAQRTGRMSGLILRAYLAGYQLTKPGLMKAEVEINGETYLAGQLNIENKPN